MQITQIDLKMGQVEADLEAFGALLRAKTELSEQKDILPFFKARPHLSVFLASFSNASLPDRYAHEYQIGGSFACDLLVGGSESNQYVFIEFEDARKNSIFRTGKRKVPEWSPRFEHGFSQIMDWFYCLEDLRHTEQFRRDFPDGVPSFIGMLVIGRSSFTGAPEMNRLKWRQDHVTINSRRILIYTFDQLLKELQLKVLVMKTLHNS